MKKAKVPVMKAKMKNQVWKIFESSFPSGVVKACFPFAAYYMAASKDILFWTPRGQLLRNKRIIPVTNIAELVEYVLLPHNNEVTKPRALNTFLDWLAEFIGIDKGLIKNKTLLSDLIEKEKGHRNAEITSENESNNEESSSDIENLEDREGSGFWEWQWSWRHPRERQRHLNDSEKTESNSHETSTTFHSENPC